VGSYEVVRMAFHLCFPWECADVMFVLLMAFDVVKIELDWELIGQGG
jgi:hypothetical protein